MITGLVTGGRPGPSVLITQTPPQLGISNSMRVLPGCALAARIACLKEPGPESAVVVIWMTSALATCAKAYRLSPITNV